MKRIAFLLLIISSSLYSQENKLRKFRFGMKVSPALGWIKPDFKDIPTPFTAESGGPRLGIVWGPVAEIQLNDVFLISTGADISYLSAKIEGRSTVLSTIGGVPTSTLYDYSNLYRFRFIEVPLLLKFRTNEIGYLRYFGLFGLGLGFRYAANTEFSKFIGSNEVIAKDDDSGTYIQSFRGSMQIGAGVEYNLSGNTSLVSSLVFNNGLTNVLKNHLEPPASGDLFNQVNETGINNFFMLNIGILF